MMFEVPSEPLELNPVAAKALDLLFILHADHEQNASTSTVRLVGSTGANPYACVAAGIAALWGPAHGGANEAVLKMLAEIGDAKNVGKAVERAKDKNSGFRLMGFGHRVYKNFDPRATIIREMTHKVLADLDVNDPLLDVAMELEEAALKDPYFVERKLYPERRFLLGPHLQGAEDSDRDVHGDVRDRAHRRLGRALARAAPGQGNQDRPAAPDLHRRGDARLRAARQALIQRSLLEAAQPPAGLRAQPATRGASACRRCDRAAPGAARPARQHGQVDRHFVRR